jgi:hypothetical protein
MAGRASPISHEGTAVMLSVVVNSVALVAATVMTHVAGLSLVLQFLAKWRTALPKRLRSIAWLLVRVAWMLILVHAADITVWALFYVWRNCFPDAESAFYFSGVTYTTVGYGDLVLPHRWRILSPVEALTGILMCGLSASLFFAIVTSIYSSRGGTVIR